MLFGKEVPKWLINIVYKDIVYMTSFLSKTKK